MSEKMDLNRAVSWVALAAALYSVYGVVFRVGVLEAAIKELAPAATTSMALTNLDTTMKQWREDFKEQMRDSKENQDRNYQAIMDLMREMKDDTQKRLNDLGRPQSMGPVHVGEPW